MKPITESAQATPQPNPTPAARKSVPLARAAAVSRFKRNLPLTLMFIPVVAFFLLFRYLPMLGNIIAFKNYNFIDGIIGSPWIGLDNFRTIFSNPQTLTMIRNTFILSLLHIVTSFPFPIIIAIMLNEARRVWFKKSMQTLLYLPHFFSWVIVGGIAVTLFGSQAGVINKLIEHFGGESISFLYQQGSWMAIFLGSSIWKEAGFGAIIYLAAIGSIDPYLYEAASIDGAGKLKQIWNITLPGLLPIMTLMLILSMGSVMDVGFDQIYNMQNAVVADVASVISTYIYTVGIQNGLYSVTTAMGLFESLIGLFLVIGTNALAKRFNQSLW